MTCDEAGILIHALLDGELDAGHAREIEEHIAGCPRCAAQLRSYREMSKAVSDADLHYTAPPALRVSRHGALQRPHTAGSRGADPLRRRPGANRPVRPLVQSEVS